jgi:hypothetical protein
MCVCVFVPVRVGFMSRCRDVVFSAGVEVGWGSRVGKSCGEVGGEVGWGEFDASVFDMYVF